MNDSVRMPIMLVEDERPLITAITSKLQNSGFDVVTATMVDQAVEYIRDNDFNISAIWLDHYLFGKKDGLDFISELKEDLKSKNIPIYVVTNTGGAEKKESYMKLGVNKYYVKSDNRLDDIVGDIKKDLS